MYADTLIEPELVTDERIRLFSLYVDYAAAVRARWVTSQITRLVGEHWKTPAEMWDLDLLTDSDPIQKMMSKNAAEADVLIVAMSSLDRRELELIQCLNSLTAEKSKARFPDYSSACLAVKNIRRVNWSGLWNNS